MAAQQILKEYTARLSGRVSVGSGSGGGRWLISAGLLALSLNAHAAEPAVENDPATVAPAAEVGDMPLPADAESLERCLKQNLPRQSLVQEMRLVAHDASGSRDLSLKVYGMRLEHEVAVMISVREPVDMRGSRYLVISGREVDAMYMYLPALGRTRRIVGSMAGQSLWGTDFSYDDVKLVRGLLWQGDSTFDPTARWNTRPAVKVNITPLAANAEEATYDRVELVVDAATCVIVSGQFFDSAGLVKTLEVQPEDLEQVDDRWMARKVHVRSPRRNSHSELIVENLLFDEDLRARLFDPRTFMIGG
ncbi:MAG: outer membrane lipoprotein-sorting protein [Oceanococcaceae bacterium]